jgi:predicted RNA-binding Zn-ribbon protein involved in translation (DUF1610 family)
MGELTKEDITKYIRQKLTEEIGLFMRKPITDEVKQRAIKQLKRAAEEINRGLPYMKNSNVRVRIENGNDNEIKATITIPAGDIDLKFDLDESAVDWKCPKCNSPIYERFADGGMQWIIECEKCKKYTTWYWDTLDAAREEHRQLFEEITGERP